MVKTCKLEELIEKCHIINQFALLPNEVLGYYCFDDGYCIILINESIKSEERIYRTVLAEEIGHYRTTIGDITPRKHMCYMDRLQIDKKELAALRWAVDFLMPTELVIDMFRNNSCLSLIDVADYFFVTEEFVMRKFEFMSKQKSIWPIDANRSLCLYNLPSVYAYYNMDYV